MPNLVGIGLSQVPTNSMLGGLAYQDPEHASIKDLDLKNLSQINSEIADTAVDVFVYDTRKDSDGGAWRKRTQHTSWYNETLGTATRGTRREFPAVAVIVAEQNFIKIYDGDDPDLPMWMVFNTIANGVSQGMAGRPMIQVQGTDKIVHALNGILVTGTKNEGSNYGQPVINFISEKVLRMDSQGGEGGEWMGNIAQRNEAIGYRSVDYDYVISASQVNDIAMTVLPNAPIDPSTGLPVPTIAVAVGNAGSGNGGVSVIKDDGTIVDIINGTGAGGYASYNVEFGSNNELIHTQAYNNSYASVNIFDDIPSSDVSASNSYSAARTYAYVNGVPDIRGGVNGASTPNLEYVSKSSNGDIAFGFQNTDAKLTLLSEPEGAGTINQNSAVAYIASDYNTGWMHGHIKGAFLSDTTAESLTPNTNLASNFVQGGTSRLTSETYDNGDTSWQMVDNAGTANGYVTIELRGLTVGQSYIISMTWDNNAALDSGYNHRVAHLNGQAGENATNFTHWNKTNGSSETLTGIFVAQSGNNDDLVMYANAITLNITNFSVRAVDDEDRSRNKKGLQVFGTITKQPVATGAELVSYSGWSSSNYLRQPYNSDLDFGTGNWSYMFWYNPNDAESGDVIFSRWSFNVDSNQGPRVSAYFNNGNLRFDTADASSGNSYQGHAGSDGTQDSNEWHCAVILRRGPNLEIWIDGVNYKNSALNSSSDGSYTDTNSILEIGHSPGTGSTEAGLELALLRASASAPSPEQIKKMYNDEKHLFQENAKATLYGSSDAVTGLAHDDSTDSLHVGTSAGRSEFQGLCRINNTTEAVTTAISASNGLVAEQ